MAHPYSGSGDADIVVTKLNSNGAYLRHTFYGASGSHDYGVSIALDRDHGVFTTGTSPSSWLGGGGAGPIHPHSGNPEGDGFVLKLSDRIYRVFLPLVVKRP